MPNPNKTLSNVTTTLQALSFIENPRDKDYASLTQQDYNILLEGIDTSTESTIRDVLSGMSLTAAIGAIGVYSSTQQTTTFVLDPKTSVTVLVWKSVLWIIIQCVIAVVCLLLAIYFHTKKKKAATKKTFLELKSRVDSFFASRQEVQRQTTETNQAGQT